LAPRCLVVRGCHPLEALAQCWMASGRLETGNYPITYNLFNDLEMDT